MQIEAANRAEEPCKAGTGPGGDGDNAIALRSEPARKIAAPCATSRRANWSKSNKTEIRSSVASRRPGRFQTSFSIASALTEVPGCPGPHSAPFI